MHWGSRTCSLQLNYSILYFLKKIPVALLPLPYPIPDVILPFGNWFWNSELLLDLHAIIIKIDVSSEGKFRDWSILLMDSFCHTHWPPYFLPLVPCIHSHLCLLSHTICLLFLLLCLSKSFPFFSSYLKSYIIRFLLWPTVFYLSSKLTVITLNCIFL